MDDLCYLDVNIWKQAKKEEVIERCDTTEKKVDMDDDSKQSCSDEVENRYPIYDICYLLLNILYRDVWNENT